MLLKNNLLEDPLKEKALPLFAKKLNINHFSPTQFSIPDGNWLFKYLVLTQEERRALPSNSQMKAGVAVNNVLQKHLADTIWKFGPQRKLTPMANQEKNKDKQEIIHAELQEFRNHIANDDKDQAKKEKYQDEIFAVCNHGFSALEKLGVATTYPITCEEQISITQEVSSLFLSVVGRTDFTFGGVQEKEGVISAPTPAGIIEIKTQWSKVGKLKKSGERSFISLSAPATPSYNHLIQCAMYAAYWNYEVPVYLIYLNKNEYKIFDSSNCSGLTVEGLKKNFQNMVTVFKRREKLLSQYENLDPQQIIENTVQIIDPMFEWPLDYNPFLNFIKSKYGSVASAQGTIHHYEWKYQEKQKLFDGTIVPQKYFEVDADTYAGLPVDQKREVSQYTYEEEKNDARRVIRVLDNVYLNTFLDEAESIFE